MTGLVLLLGVNLLAAPQPVLVVDVRSMDRPTKILAASAEGLLNREAPRAYLLWDDNSVRWLTWDKQRFGLRTRKVELADLLRAAARRAHGYVLWTPDNEDTAVAGGTVAGAEGLLLAAPKHEDLLRSMGLQRRLDLAARSAGWSRTQLFRWLFDTYRDRCTRSYLHNSSITGRVSLDVTKYVGQGGFRLRFEDETKADGFGAKLRSLTVLADGKKVAQFRVFSEDEKPYLLDADHSWPDGARDRIADRDQYFVYEFAVAAARKVTVLATVTNGYLIKAAPRGSEAYVELQRPQAKANNPGLQVRSFDISIALNCLSVDLSANPEDKDEYSLRDEIEKWLKPPACFLGWHTERDGEGRYVDDASEHGHFVICTGAANLSFHRHLKPASLPRPKLAQAPKLDPHKTYVSFILSDGDALWCDQCFQGENWLSPRRGQVPFGWELQPLLVDLAPDMLTYYCETATEKDCLVAAFAAGYNHPNKMSEPDLDRYLSFCHRTLERTGFHLATVLCSGAARRDLAEKYARALGDLIIGEQEGYGGMGGEDWVLPNMLWLRARLPRNGRMSADQLVEDIEAYARRFPQRPLFIPGHLHLPLAGHLDAVWQVSRRLDPDHFEVVRPDQLFLLARQWYSTHPVIQVPSEFVAVEGLGAAVEAKVENTTPQKLLVAFDGTGLVARPQRLTLQPYTQGTVTLAWPTPPKGSSVVVRASYGGSRQEYSLQVRHMKVDASLLAGAREVRTVRALDAAMMGHRFGRAEKIAGSQAQLVWVARSRPGGTRQGHIAYGAYAPLPAGRYLFVWRLQRLGQGKAPVARIDVAADYGKFTAARRDLSPDALPAGRWVEVALPVQTENALQACEARVEWLGGAPLAVDRVYVLELK
ncbi:MAG: hypothetical protein J7M26_07790, partial [Armatimonadetes bacterium]|nr:hypothetical protein [Armatimonadota bacterium]